jgi:hypothetical protein
VAGDHPVDQGDRGVAVMDPNDDYDEGDGDV